MYVAVSGAIAAQKRLDSIANNIANVNTAGFKSDKLVFESYLAKSEREGEPGAPVKGKGAAALRQAEFVVATESYADYTVGSIRETGSPYDIAIAGNGFLSVMTYEGERFTRAGNLSKNEDGALVSSQGYPVLDETNRLIYVNDKYVTIDKEGSVWLTNNEEFQEYSDYAGKIKIVEFLKPENLVKEGNGLYRSDNPAEGFAARDTRVIQGSLESSNVNIIREMTAMIQNQRITESYTKVIQTSDQMTGTLLSNLGRP
ncbi:Flagellar basal-body rod protein FlgG [hydrothermal vent metagenome]|uniref:Flagellar basal-body rod protein FlgG n=1 Tax=hydrothermal vent metagenome TaxID=652676 RepID=A0A3B1BFG5_9ZZZZ